MFATNRQKLHTKLNYLYLEIRPKYNILILIRAKYIGK